MLTFHVITLFPEIVQGYASQSILGKAQESGAISVQTYNPMEYTTPRTEGALPQRVDARPYGGGPGMVIRAEPIIAAVKDAVGRKRNVGYIHFKPRAEHFTTDYASRIAQESLASKGAVKDVVIFCGRYEGIDSRIEEIFPGKILSIGDYVLTGGEIPAMVVIDSVSRQLPGVLGDEDSREEGRQAAGKYYTRPESITYKKEAYSIPEVLRQGNHKEIEKWRARNA